MKAKRKDPEPVVTGWRILQYTGPEEWVRQCLYNPDRYVQGHIEVSPTKSITEWLLMMGLRQEDLQPERNAEGRTHAKADKPRRGV